jgi:hypothetical protein
MIVGVIVAGVLAFVAAPYGRHGRAGWGPQVPARVGWIVMESPAVLVFGAIYLQGAHRAEVVPLLLLGVWMLHYVHRAAIFPFRMRTAGRTMPAVVVLMAIVFNLANAYVNARWISHLGSYALGWLLDVRLVVGVAMFAVGMGINLASDTRLLALRRDGQGGYRIPRGGLFRWVSCPNYGGELLEWVGWAVATWSLAGLSFAVFTACNLVPRAIAHHAWYRRTFHDYPPERRAIVPFVL